MILEGDLRVRPRYFGPQPCPHVWHVAQLGDELSLDSWHLARMHNPRPPTRQANRRLAGSGSLRFGLAPWRKGAERYADWAQCRRSTPRCCTELGPCRLK